jgi:hypothetical protein
MDGGGRPRNAPNGIGVGGARTPGNDSRRPPGAPGGPASSASSATGASGMSRAERFDDERRRITESCFARVDDQGQRRCPLPVRPSHWGNHLSRTMKHGLALTTASYRIVHHSHPRAGRRRVSVCTSPAKLEPCKQEATRYHCICACDWQGPPPQGARKCKRHLFNRQDVEHGGAYRCRELCAHDPVKR